MLMRRPETMRAHPAQISFCGGGVEEQDDSLLATALREAEEEIGVCQRTHGLRVLGALRHSFPSIASAFRVSAFVAAVPRVASYRVNHDEVARVLEVPLRHLIDDERFDPAGRYGRGYRGPLWTIEERVPDERSEDHVPTTLWGLTAHVTQHFLFELSRAMRD